MKVIQNIYTPFFENNKDIISGIPVNVEYQIYLHTMYEMPIIYRYATISDNVCKCVDDLLHYIGDGKKFKVNQNDIYKVNVNIESNDVRMSKMNSIVVLSY